MMTKMIRFLIICLLLTALLPVAMPARAAESAPVRIMPLGDSITSSMNGFASYRYWLWHHLLDLHYSVDFIGSQYGVWNGTPKYPDFDQDHEGHSGWTSQMLWDLVRDMVWTSLNTPDVVLMHIGTAGLCGLEPPSTIRDNESQIIDRIRLVNSQVDILVAQIIPAQPVGVNEACASYLSDVNIRDLNSKIAAMAAAKNTPASRVIAVDMYSGYDAVLDNISDHIHPNESGEKKIAARWTVALIDLLGGYGNRIYLPITAR